MHVLILGGSSDHRGGVEIFCERAIQALGQRGHDQIAYMPTNTAYLTLNKMPRLLTGLLRLVRYSRLKPDIIWLQYVTLPDLIYLAAARAIGLRVLVTPHLGVNWRSQRGLLRRISTVILKCANRLALISKSQEEELMLPGAVPRSYIRTFLSPGYLNLDACAPTRLSKEIRLIHASRLSEAKGTFDYIDMCSRLRDAGVSFHARIAGAGDAQIMAQLATRIEQADLGSRVELLGRLEEGELIDALRNSDVLVHLSRIDSYPLIVLESIACSVFPVCLDLAGARNMIDTYDGHLVHGAQAVEQVVTFLRSIDHIDLGDRANLAARQVIVDYSWPVCLDALDDALNMTVARRAVSAVPSPG